MAKPIKTKTSAATAKDQDLNRWCIEMAMRWPMIHVPASYGNAVQGGVGIGGYAPPMPARDVEADVIGRAAKIFSWVKTAH